MTTKSPAPDTADPDGEMVFARRGDPAYTAATSTYNLANKMFPTAARTVNSTEEVVRAVAHARAANLPLRVIATGHGASSKSSLRDALLIRTEFTAPVTVDPQARTARIPAGVLWSTVVEAAAEHGLVAMHGSAGTISAVGYLLRGGVSFYGRKFGLGANSLISVTIVLADGQIVVASESNHPELFWALRGGGGGFGVVTEVEIQLYPMSAVVAGATIWSARHAERIVPLWTRWAAEAPTEISTSLRLMNLPPLPGIPSELTSEQILVIDGAVVVPTPQDEDKAQAHAADLLATLREKATPVMDTWHVADPREMLHIHMDPPDPMPYLGEHVLLNELGDEGVARFLDAAGPDSGTSLTIAELRQLGGAFANPDRVGGALDRVAAPYAQVLIGAVGDGRGAEQVDRELHAVSSALAPWSTGTTIPSVVESHDAVQRSFDDRTAQQVSAIRAQVDPTGMFSGDVDAIRDQIDPFSSAMEARVSNQVLGNRKHGIGHETK